MTCVLSLDISMTRTGWALGGEDWNRPRWGVFETDRWPDRQGENLVALVDWLDSIGDTYALTHLTYEKVFVNANPAKFQWNGTEAQLMMAGTVVQWATRRKLKVFRIEIDDWRKRFLGLNRRPKDFKKDDNYWKNLALRVCAQDHNWFCQHHDEAEALGILDYSLANLSPAYARRTLRSPAKQERDIDHKTGAHA